MPSSIFFRLRLSEGGDRQNPADILGPIQSRGPELVRGWLGVQSLEAAGGAMPEMAASTPVRLVPAPGPSSPPLAAAISGGSFLGSSGSAPTSGVGITFALVQDRGGEQRAVVASTLKGGAADEDGTLRVGDILCRVDGEQARGFTLPQIRAAIVGPPGTSVLLEVDRDGKRFHTSLRRGGAAAGSPGPLDSTLTASRLASSFHGGPRLAAWEEAAGTGNSAHGSLLHQQLEKVQTSQREALAQKAELSERVAELSSEA